jgi:Hydrolases of the alpha/beta superfamily
MEKIVDHVIPGPEAWKKMILRNYWPSVDRIAAISSPILFVSGGKDQLVPPSHMEELRNKAKSAKFVDWKFVENGDHNDTWEKAKDQYPLWIHSFIEKSLALTPYL